MLVTVTLKSELSVPGAWCLVPGACPVAYATPV